MERGATGRGRWGGEMEMGEMERGRWGGGNEGGDGEVGKGEGQKKVQEEGGFTYEMLGWTYGMPGVKRGYRFFDFVYPCNAGYHS